MREKIADILWEINYRSWPREMYLRKADQILSLFRAEIEKLGVMSDKQIAKLYRDRNWFIFAHDLTRAEALAQAQLAKDKEDLLKKLEGK